MRKNWFYSFCKTRVLLCHFKGFTISLNIHCKAAVTIWSDFGTQENKICHCFYFSPIYLLWSMGPDAMILVFWMLSFKPAFNLSSFTVIKRLFSSSSLSAVRNFCCYHCISEVAGFARFLLELLHFSHQSWFQNVVIQPGILHDILCIYVK